MCRSLVQGTRMHDLLAPGRCLRCLLSADELMHRCADKRERGLAPLVSQAWQEPTYLCALCDRCPVSEPRSASAAQLLRPGSSSFLAASSSYPSFSTHVCACGCWVCRACITRAVDSLQIYYYSCSLYITLLYRYRLLRFYASSVSSGPVAVCVCVWLWGLGTGERRFTRECCRMPSQ